MSDIVMPRLSDSMEEGTVVRWLKQPGDTVVRGEAIVEIETDKATITYESDVEGVIVQILVGEGQTVPIGTQIAHLRDAAAGESKQSQFLPGATGEQLATEGLAPLSLPSNPAPLPTPQETADFEPQQYTGDEPTFEPQPQHQDFGDTGSIEPDTGSFESAAPQHSTEGDAQSRVKASPIARRLARKLGVNLEHVEGTGPGGRIVKEDVESAANAATQPAGQGPAIHAPSPDEPIFTPYEPEPAFSPAPLPNDFGSTGEHDQFTGEQQYTGEQPAFTPMPPPPAPTPQQYPPQPYPPAPQYPQQQQYPPPGYPPAQQQPFPGPPPFVAGMTGNYPAIPTPQQPQQPQQPPAQQPPAPQTQPPQQTAPPAAGGTATRGQSTPSELTNAQQTVARRMAESKATAPEFFVETDVDMTNAVSYREQLRQAVSPVPSFNDFVIKASAQALRQYPKVNGAYKDGHYEQYGDVNIGVVVSSDDLLAVPTLFNVDQKGLGQIARESHALADAVRNRTIQPSQLSAEPSACRTSACTELTASPRFSIRRRRRSLRLARSIAKR